LNAINFAHILPFSTVLKKCVSYKLWKMMGHALQLLFHPGTTTRGWGNNEQTHLNMGAKNYWWMPISRFASIMILWGWIDREITPRYIQTAWCYRWDLEFWLYQYCVSVPI